jgi:hypothetical protein
MHGSCRPHPLPSKIPTVEALGTDRVTAPKDVQQFPLDFLSPVKDSLDYLANACQSDNWFERLIDIHDVRRKTAHRGLYIERGPRIDEASHVFFVTCDDIIFFDEIGHLQSPAIEWSKDAKPDHSQVVR